MTCTSFKHLLNITDIYGTDLKGRNIMNWWWCKVFAIIDSSGLTLDWVITFYLTL